MGPCCNAAMSIRLSPWPVGVPSWADLTVPDVAAAKAFYAEVLGWSYQAVYSRRSSWRGGP
jgi:hypothetical protein